MNSRFILKSILLIVLLILFNFLLIFKYYLIKKNEYSLSIYKLLRIQSFNNKKLLFTKFNLVNYLIIYII